jgi:hypothetical protein
MVSQGKSTKLPGLLPFGCRLPKKMRHDPVFGTAWHGGCDPWTLSSSRQKWNPQGKLGCSSVLFYSIDLVLEYMLATDCSPVTKRA